MTTFDRDHPIGTMVLVLDSLGNMFRYSVNLSAEVSIAEKIKLVNSITIPQEMDEIVLPNLASECFSPDSTAFQGIFLDYRRFNSDSMLHNFSREERGYGWPAFWKMDDWR